jgi:integrase
MLLLAYSAGLRLAEIVRLELKDIDVGRMQIHIRGGKGKRDRMVTLSPVMLAFLRSIRHSTSQSFFYLKARYMVIITVSAVCSRYLPGQGRRWV